MPALQLAWDGPTFRGYGDPTNRFDPPAHLVKNKQPEAGLFFRPLNQNPNVLISTIALRVYGEGNTANGVVAIANSTWNQSHIRYAAKGFEPYGVQGPQQEKKYSTDPLSEFGSGTYYPTLWLPPLDNPVEPEEYFGWSPAIEPGTGPIGPVGPAGRPPTAEEIAAAVAEWIAANPLPPGPIGPPGTTGEQGEQGIPGPAGEPPSAAEIQAAVTQYFVDNPPPVGTVSDEAIHAAVQAYLQANPPSQGPQGIPGVPGPPGPDPTDDQIQAAVSLYLQNNPPSGGSVSQADIAAAVAAYLQANPPSGATLSPAQVEAAVNAYLQANPLPPGPIGPPGEVSQEMIDQAVNQWFQNNPGSASGGGKSGSPLSVFASLGLAGLAMKMGIY